MNDKKNTNLVAGRLGNIPAPNRQSSPGAGQRTAESDKGRLGIITPAEPAAEETRPTTSPPQAPTGFILHICDLAKSWKFDRRVQLVAGALGCLAVTVLTSIVWSWCGGNATASGMEKTTSRAVVQDAETDRGVSTPPAAKAKPTDSHPIALSPSGKQSLDKVEPRSIRNAAINNQAGVGGVWKSLAAMLHRARPTQRPTAPRRETQLASQYKLMDETPGLGKPRSSPARPAAKASADTVAPVKRYMPTPSGIRLSGIVRRPGSDLANINGRFVGVGHKINGAKVVEIREFSVEMEMDGKCFLIGMGSSPAGK